MGGKICPHLLTSFWKKKKLRQCIWLWTLQKHNGSFTLIANRPSQVGGAALGNEPRRTRATSVMLHCLQPAAASVGECQQSRVRMGHWSRRSCHGSGTDPVRWNPQGVWPFHSERNQEQVSSVAQLLWAWGGGISPSLRFGEAVHRSQSQYCPQYCPFAQLQLRAELPAFAQSSVEVELLCIALMMQVCHQKKMFPKLLLLRRSDSPLSFTAPYLLFIMKGFVFRNRDSSYVKAYTKENKYSTHFCIRIYYLADQFKSKKKICTSLKFFLVAFCIHEDENKLAQWFHLCAPFIVGAERIPSRLAVPDHKANLQTH